MYDVSFELETKFYEAKKAAKLVEQITNDIQKLRTLDWALKSEEAGILLTILGNVTHRLNMEQDSLAAAIIFEHEED